MTVKELKELIKNIPDDVIIVVDGYERGLKLVEKTYLTDIYDCKNNTTLYGEFIDKEDQFFKLKQDRGELTYVSKAFCLSREYIDEYKYNN